MNLKLSLMIGPLYKKEQSSGGFYLASISFKNNFGDCFNFASLHVENQH